MLFLIHPTFLYAHNRFSVAVQSLASSDYHPMLAMGITDGSCMTTNTLKSTRRGGLVVRVASHNHAFRGIDTPTQPPLEHKIYQLDYSRALGEFRMLEQFLPKVRLPS